MKYKINRISPCADYHGYTTEIDVSEEFNETFLKRALFNLMDHVDCYDIANIIVADYGNKKIYIYDNKKTIIVHSESIIDSEETINDIIDEYNKQKEL